MTVGGNEMTVVENVNDWLLVENVIDFQNVTSRSDVFGKVKFFG
jgi:hypothetical protein